MKKNLLLIIVAASAIFSACSSDQDNAATPVPSNLLQTKINNVEVNYDVISSSTESYSVDGENYTDLIINASKAGDPSEIMTFKSEYLQPGSESCFYFHIVNDDIEYDTDNQNSFSMHISESTANSLKGTFSGTLNNFDNTKTAIIANGTFDIKF